MVTTPHTILLKGRGIRKEAVAGGTITPGHLLTINSSGKLVVHATAKGKAAPLFAVENDLEGKEIDDNYVANDFVQSEYLYCGMEAYALVAAGASSIAVGDLLESAGDGTLRKRTAESQLTTGNYTFTSGGNAVAQALDALDNSGGSDPARLRVVIV
jgi:hypothetical protein